MAWWRAERDRLAAAYASAWRAQAAGWSNPRLDALDRRVLDAACALAEARLRRAEARLLSLDGAGG